MKEVGAGFHKQQKTPLQSRSFPYIHIDMQELVCVCLQTGLELAWGPGLVWGLNLQTFCLV